MDKQRWLRRHGFTNGLWRLEERRSGATTWKIGDPDDTARVARKTGIPVEKLSEMAANARRARLPWDNSEEREQ